MIVDGAFLVASCDAARLLEPVDQALDAVALAIGGAIEAGIAALIAFSWDHWGDTTASQAAARGRTGIGFVAGNLERAQPRPASPRSADRPLIEQPLQGDLLLAFAAGQHCCNRAAVALGTQVQFSTTVALISPVDDC